MLLIEDNVRWVKNTSHSWGKRQPIQNTPKGIFVSCPPKLDQRVPFSLVPTWKKIMTLIYLLPDDVT